MDGNREKECVWCGVRFVAFAATAPVVVELGKKSLESIRRRTGVK